MDKSTDDCAVKQHRDRQQTNSGKKQISQRNAQPAIQLLAIRLYSEERRKNHKNCGGDVPVADGYFHLPRSLVRAIDQQ